MIVGKKLGMTQIFTETGELVSVTLLQIISNVVVDKKNEETHGYASVVVGYDKVKEKVLNKPDMGQFAKRNLAAHRHLIEFEPMHNDVSVGTVLDVDLFNDIHYVDVSAFSKGKGMQGGMKRWGFKGGPATHGSKFHRHIGGTGQATHIARVQKGVKMPGRMGNARVTVQNLSVMKIDKEKQVLFLRGAVPGAKQSYVIVQKSKKKG